jgi:prolyl oligopeptidase
VRSRLYKYTLKGKEWKSEEIALPGLGSAGVAASHDRDDVFYVGYNDFLTPSSLYIVKDGRTLEKIKSTPAEFDPTGMKVEQYEATSKDGTKVPYFVVHKADLKLDGSNPTLVYGYGGFQVSYPPNYSGTVGKLWLEQGGVYVVANIRGGGEFGPAWHQAALKRQRQRSFDDFIAVAEDLIARRVTRPGRLGIEGGSNGGLLVGAVMLQRPELFGAVVCQVPLLDMQRYHLLLAGASWMAEYGDPDDAQDWASIRQWSPYHNVPAAAERRLPEVLLTTSTRDDRVHPGHARKMAARLREQGQRVLYWENIEGGHGGAADNAQRATMMALEYGFLRQRLGLQ